jgi:hypothetical protein
MAAFMDSLAALALLLSAQAAASQAPSRDPTAGTGPEEPWRPISVCYLHRLCTDGRDNFDRCDAYISAIGDALSARSGTALLCPPRLRAHALTRRSVVRHLEGGATNGDGPAAQVVELALLATYPCRSRP